MQLINLIFQHEQCFFKINGKKKLSSNHHFAKIRINNVDKNVSSEFIFFSMIEAKLSLSPVLKFDLRVDFFPLFFKNLINFILTLLYFNKIFETFFLKIQGIF